MLAQVVKTYTDLAGNHTIVCLLVDPKYPNGQIEITREFAAATSVASMQTQLDSVATIVEGMYS